MYEDNEQIARLLKNYVDNQLSDSDSEQLKRWLAERSEHRSFFESFIQKNGFEGKLKQFDTADEEKVWHRILEQTTAGRQVSVFNMLRPVLLAVASIAGIILLSTWFYLQYRPSDAAEGNSLATTTEIYPTGKKALLTLGDGSVIELDGKTAIGPQGNSQVSQPGSGQLSYTADAGMAGAIVFNTLTTPKGAEHKIILPDGSRAWLNASSSIRFPTSFLPNERRVQISGEVYFEVQKQYTDNNRRMPFIVDVQKSADHSGLCSIEVLGTEFNVNAYTNESAVKATLLGGKIKMSNAFDTLELKPGHQSQLLKNGRFRLLSAVDTSEAVAWKNGSFQFENADLPAILRQIERWYDVRVDYQHNTQRKFTLSIEKSVPLSSILRMLEQTKAMHFKVVDRQVTVLP